MRTLAFDTSTPSTAVGLMLEDGSVLSAYDHPDRAARPGHQARLLPLAAELLERAGLEWDALDRVGVGVGPGTYTGLRVGVASARALAQSLAAELVGVSSASVLAHAALHRSSQSAGANDDPPEAVLTVVDARRGEVFMGAYSAGAPDSFPVAIGSPRPVALEDAAAAIARLIAPSEANHSPAPSRWLAVGDGADSLRAALEAAGVHTPPDGSPLHDLDAVVLCELARRALAQPLETVLPDYCREPDAELALKRRERAAHNGGDASESESKSAVAARGSR